MFLLQPHCLSLLVSQMVERGCEQFLHWGRLGNHRVSIHGAAGRDLLLALWWTFGYAVLRWILLGLKWVGFVLFFAVVRAGKAQQCEAAMGTELLLHAAHLCVGIAPLQQDWCCLFAPCPSCLRGNSACCDPLLCLELWGNGQLGPSVLLLP